VGDSGKEQRGPEYPISNKECPMKYLDVGYSLLAVGYSKKKGGLRDSFLPVNFELHGGFCEVRCSKFDVGSSTFPR
jgi:hypothetical protein